MADKRTRREKLEAMANQTESPNERAIARSKLGLPPEGEYTEINIGGFIFRIRVLDNPTIIHRFDPAEAQRTSHDNSPTFCPNCGHGEYLHAGGMCYGLWLEPCSCHWSILGTGNAAGLDPGWHSPEDMRASWSVDGSPIP